jgi:hypothetical protein
MSRFLDRIKRIEGQINIHQMTHLELHDEFGLSIYWKEADNLRSLTYKPSATGKLFHASKAQLKAIMGPFGSGKSTAACMEMIMQTARMPKNASGLRMAKYAVIRNTAAELETTSLKTWLAWADHLGSCTNRKKPVLNYEYVFWDKDGRIDLEIIFLALDRAEDIRKLKSLEITGAYINEASEIEKVVIQVLAGRLHRYPSRISEPGDFYSYIMMDYNPPPDEHYLFDMFEKKPSKDEVLFKQPPGLLVDDKGKPLRNEDGDYIANPECDNYENFNNKNYYVDMAKLMSEEQVKVFCLGQYGLLRSGKPVYEDYNDDLHSAFGIVYDPSLPLNFGWDFGLTPACVIFQITLLGQVRVIKEFCATSMGITALTKNVVLPFLKMNYPNYTLGHSTGDPAGSKRSETDESVCLEILGELGLPTLPASTNAIVKRIECVRNFLNRIIEGKAAVQLDRKECGMLRKGFMSGYHYKKLKLIGDDKYQDEPNKNDFSHIHDAFQYGLMPFSAIFNSKKDTTESAKAIINLIPGGVYG